MYGVMIVDDEPWVREGITNLIDWQEHGMEILASVEDGVEALEHVRSGDRMPDIVLTDIRMPEKSGLQLIEELSELNPRVRFVILSGYRDFEYARTAIRYGVFEYMVKPIGRSSLLDTMIRLTADIANISEGNDEMSANTAAGNVDNQRASSDPRGSRATAWSDAVSKNGSASRPILISRMLASVERHITEAVGLVELAEELSVNPSYLSALFSESMHETFKQYLTRRKVQKAKEIWRRHPWLKVYELCTHVGYIDVNYFSHVFKQVEGVTPRQFKQGLRCKSGDRDELGSSTQAEP